MDKLNEAIGKLTAFAEQNGSAAYDVLAYTAQLNAIGDLVGAVAACAAAAACIFAAFRFSRRADRTGKDDDTAAAIVSTILAAILTLIAIIAVFCDLLDPVVWASAFDGNTALAAKLLKAVTAAK